MESLVLKKGKISDSQIIAKAVKALQEGKVIAFPTETSYGLATDAENEAAIAKVRSIKRMGNEKPISIIVADLKMAERYGKIDQSTKKLISRFMPGPLTLIVNKTPVVPDILAKESIAFRISSHKIAEGLTKKLGKAITATSANVTGEKPCYSAEEIVHTIGNDVDLLIDYGKLPKRKASTLFDVRQKKVLRQGKISEKQIEKALK